MKKLLFICLILFLASGVFFYTNTYEFKIQSFQTKFKNDIKELNPIYKNALKYCSAQNFTNRGPGNACMEEKIKNSSLKNYNFYINVQNLCKNITDNLADKWMCVDEVID